MIDVSIHVSYSYTNLSLVTEIGYFRSCLYQWNSQFFAGTFKIIISEKMLMICWQVPIFVFQCEAQIKIIMMISQIQTKLISFHHHLWQYSVLVFSHCSEVLFQENVSFDFKINSEGLGYQNVYVKDIKREKNILVRSMYVQLRGLKNSIDHSLGIP